jgi:SAM-dependent methyltransferase
MQGAAFRLHPKGEALVIGSGGGVDVVVGLYHGARHVVAVDVNPKTMEFVRGRYASFAGGVFNRPDVEPIVSEGRHFLSRDRRQFDVIQLSGVDTWAALSSGAIALTENFIYTAEAFDEYLAHLKPDGVLGFSRPYFSPPLETMRLSATALAALERRGVSDAFRHLFVIAGQGQAADGPWAELLVKRSPFTEQEVSGLARWATELGFEVIFDPFVQSDLPLDYLARPSPADRRARIERFDLNVHPATDDAPFYFQYHRWRDLFRPPPLGAPPPAAMLVLAASLFQVSVLSALFILYPLRRLRPAVAMPRFGRAALFCYFASLGLGFILVEIGLLPKLTIFLGGPAYALAITLFTLLSCAGLGSLLSSRRASDPLELVAKVIPAAAVLIVLAALSLDTITTRLLGLPLVGRAAASVLLIGPIGLLLGMPFPAGLRYLDVVSPELKPWAWGINACATVVGTSLCMILVTALGFRSAFFVGAAVYALGYVALRASSSRSAIVAAPAPAPG